MILGFCHSADEKLAITQQVGESCLIWGGFLIWGDALFHTRRCCTLLKNVNHQADEAVLCNHSINGQLVRTLALTGRLCFGALYC